MPKKTLPSPLLSDFLSLPTHPADPELAAVEAALFAEECCGLSLTDADMVPEKLGSEEALRRFLAERMGC